MEGSPDRGRAVHLARPNRPALVAKSLGELRGPEHGGVELPQRLFWNPNRSFDLDNHDLLLWSFTTPGRCTTSGCRTPRCGLTSPTGIKSRARSDGESEIAVVAHHDGSVNDRHHEPCRWWSPRSG